MQFVRFSHAGAPPQWGVAMNETVFPLSEAPGGEPTLVDITTPSYQTAIRQACSRGAFSELDRSAVQVLAPVPDPGKIVCVGLNYYDHAEEQEEEPPAEPLLFGKAPTCVTNPGSPIVHPPGEEVDYEVELGVVIGRHARDVPAASAPEYIAGYTVVNDVSGRAAQMGDEQFFRGKSYDTFAPMGPTLVTGDGFDPNAAAVRTRVNGDTKQSSNTDQFIFDVYELVEYISHNMTLRPGDIISTGTPGGVGIFRNPPELLEPGDIVEVEIDGIGMLRNPVVDGSGSN